MVETHSIDYIPGHLRHGKPSDLLFVWFGANMELPVMAAGAATVAAGFSLAWAIAAIVIGVGIGTLLMAYHSAQGPHLGLPQMIQSRAQFGYYGAALPLVLVVVMYLGFYAAGAVLGGQALAALFHIPLSLGIIVLSALSALLAIFGYNVIHRAERYLSYFFAAIFAALTVALAVLHPLPAAHAAGHGFAIGAFLLAVSVSATSQLGYAPYVADYSRYLPAKSTVSSVFWYTYAGSGVSALWLMILGAVLEAHATGGTVGALGTIAGSVGGWFRDLTYVALAFGILSINALNIYGGYMSSLSVFTTFYRNWKPGLRLRLWFIIPVALLATYMSFLYKDNLLGAFEEFLVLVLAFIIPWTAINLTDYYLVRRGRYTAAEMFRPDGRYGRVSLAGLIAYAAGFGVQIPFMNNSVYEGPVAGLFHGGDISWAVGAVVSGAVYLLAMRRRAPEPAAAEDPEPTEAT